MERTPWKREREIWREKEREIERERKKEGKKEKQKKRKRERPNKLGKEKKDRKKRGEELDRIKESTPPLKTNVFGDVAKMFLPVAPSACKK